MKKHLAQHLITRFLSFKSLNVIIKKSNLYVIRIFITLVFGYMA